MSGTAFSSKSRVLYKELGWGLLPKLQPAEPSAAGEACCQGHTLPAMSFKLSQPLESLCNISRLSSATETECRHFLSCAAVYDRLWNGGKSIRHELNKANMTRFYSHCFLARMLLQMNPWIISWWIQTWFVFHRSGDVKKCFGVWWVRFDEVEKWSGNIATLWLLQFI